MSDRTEITIGLKDRLKALALLAETRLERIEKQQAEVERLRGLLHECLSFALGAPIGWSSDLWERVTETLGE